MRVRLRERLPLLLILLLGTGLRLHRLGADSLWYDETVSAYLAGSPLGELIRHTAGDIHPPGYYMLLRGWLTATGYPSGHADPSGMGLEFAAGFFSLVCGVALIALVYSLARAIVGRITAVTAAAAVAISPYNIWYSQETRMYTLAASLGLVVLYALLLGTGLAGRPDRRWKPGALLPWAAYAACAAAGLYTLYYFAFLLLAVNLWVAALLLLRRIRRDRTLPWVVANIAALVLYAPWAPIAWRQALFPPVPPWRSDAGLLFALRESWRALSLGQSAPAWVWPVMLLALLLYIIGLLYLLGFTRTPTDPPEEPTSSASTTARDAANPLAASFLPVTTFGSLGLILIASAAAAPLYHVRYVFTYSPAVYIVLAGGLMWVWRRWKAVAAIAAAAWLAAAAVTVNASWYDPRYRPDDLRGAAAFLQSKWRPGDLVIVNAGYSYPALLTYWQGPVGSLKRLTSALPAPGSDESLVAVMTGHVDGEPGLGWGDPRSDFFAMPADQALEQIQALFERFPRVWHYRIYDTVSDPDGQLRAALDRFGKSIEDRAFAGEANMRVQGFIPRTPLARPPGAITTHYPPDLELTWAPVDGEVIAGETIHPVLTWLAEAQPGSDIATSVRLIGADGAVWSQPPDERPLGEMLPAREWSAGQVAQQTLALPIPPGTPPGDYTAELVVYDPQNGALRNANGPGAAEGKTRGGIVLGRLQVQRPAANSRLLQSSGRFGPLALVEGTTPATIVAPGDAIPVELTWQAVEPPGEPLVVVVQLLDGAGKVAAGLEAQPLNGRYPTQKWAAGEVVRDRHTLNLSKDLQPGSYHLIIGVYRAEDRRRLEREGGLLGRRDALEIKEVVVR